MSVPVGLALDQGREIARLKADRLLLLDEIKDLEEVNAALRAEVARLTKETP